MCYAPKYLKLERESLYMTDSLVSGSNLYYIDIISDGMNPDQGFIDPETAGYLETRIRLPGGFLVTGDIATLADANQILPILHLFTGSYAGANQASGSAVCSYVFTPTLNVISAKAALNPNIADGGTYKHRVLRGFVIKAIELTAASREACRINLTCQASSEALEAKDASAEFSITRPFSFTDGILTDMTLGGVSMPIENLTLRSERVIADDNFVLGSRFLPFIHAGGYSVSGTLSFGFRNWDIYKRFWGSASATEVQASPQSYALSLKFTGDVITGTKTTFLKVDVPKVYLDTTNANIDRRERIIQDVDFTGVFDTALCYAVKFTVQAQKLAPAQLWGPG